MLEVNDLTFSYRNHLSPVLHNICFSIGKGTILTVLGPNGAGKSTLLNCLSGELLPQQGQILLDKDDIRSLSSRDIACRIGYVRQSINSDITFTVREFVLMGCTPHMSILERPRREMLEAAARIMEQMGLDSLAENRICDLSGGERQQAMIAQVLVQDPQIILFDEPTAHLDYSNQIIVLQRIASLADSGYTIIMTTHNPEQAILLDDMVGVLEKDGAFTIGMTQDILTTDFLSRVYNTKLKLIRIPEHDRLVCLCPPVKRSNRI